LKTGEICEFSQNLSFGVFVGMFVFCGRLANSQKNKLKKVVMIFYESLIILLYSWLHIGEKKFEKI
jgi:hypothetical protein